MEGREAFFEASASDRSLKGRAFKERVPLREGFFEGKASDKSLKRNVPLREGSFE